MNKILEAQRCQVYKEAVMYEQETRERLRKYLGCGFLLWVASTMAIFYLG